MSDANNLVKQAIAAYKANDKSKARDLLLKAVDLDERHEQAWMWMSAVVDSVDEQQICLENVLSINPNNERAQKGLALLKQKNPKKPPAASPPPPAGFAGLDLGSTPFSSDSSDPWGAAPAASSPPAADSWGGIATPSTDDPWGAIPSTPAAPPPPPTSTSPFITTDANDPWAAFTDTTALSSPEATFTPPPLPADDPWGSAPAPASNSDAWGFDSPPAPPADPFGGPTPFSSASSTANEAWSGGSEPAFETLAPSASPGSSRYSSSSFAFGDAYEFTFADEADDDDLDSLFGAELDLDAVNNPSNLKAQYFNHLPADLRKPAKGGSRVGQVALIAILFVLNALAAIGLVIA